MKIFYKPTVAYMLVDLVMLTAWIFVVLQWFPLTTTSPFNKYLFPAILYIFSWSIWSYLIGRYQPLRKQLYIHTAHKLIYTSILILVVFHAIIIIYFFNKLSHNVLYTITVGEFTLNLIFLTSYFSYRYAIEYNEYPILETYNTKKRDPETTVFLDDKSSAEVISKIKNQLGLKGVEYLTNKVKLNDSKTMVLSANEPELLKQHTHNEYTSIIQLQELNTVNGINKLLCKSNKLLMHEGTLVCCFESKSTYKKSKLKNSPKRFGKIIYALDFIVKRLFPKLIITRWFYFFFSGCKYRVLSKAEVLGRLYCCGFKVEEVKKIEGKNFVFAKKIKPSNYELKRTYGPLIRLKRYGKNGKPFEVYKMRTMHPYSEFLQAYIYERNNLKEGGKFNKDIRITTLGRYMRKYWLDELPMILNLLKGEMKLVGVRPLSPHYFSLYKKELQEKRNKFKPGLLPPFYADMPKTLEEIQLSELKYLTLCETNSTIATDIRYFVLILKNIVFKKERSA